MSKEHAPTLNRPRAIAAEFLSGVVTRMRAGGYGGMTAEEAVEARRLIKVSDQKQPEVILDTGGGSDIGLAGAESLDELMSAFAESDERAATDIAASQSNDHGF